MFFFSLLFSLILMQCDHFNSVSSYFVDNLFTRPALNRWSNSTEDCGINWLPLERRQFPCFKRMPIKEHEKREKFDRIYTEGANATLRVVGGSDALPGEFPWSVSVEHYYTTHDRWIRGCQGAFLQSNWVVTAGHCLFLNKSSDEVVPISNIRIKYSADARRYDELIPVKVAAVFYHPSYVPINPTDPQHDISLLRLEQKVVFEQIRRPNGQRHYYMANAICLPEDPWTIGSHNEDLFWLSSYGPISYSSSPKVWPVVLQKFMNIPREFFIPQYNSTMLAEFFKIGYTTCKGDSGSPIAVHNSDGRFFLAGVHVTTLRKYNATTICGYENGFAVRYNAEYVLNWIKETILNANQRLNVY